MNSTKPFIKLLFLLAVIIMPSVGYPFVCSNFIEQDDWKGEFRVAAVIPESGRLKDIFSTFLVDYQFEGQKKVNENIEAWASVEYIGKTGRSTFSHDKTKLCIVPFGLGVKFYIPTYSTLKPYLGLGVNYSHLYIHNDSDAVKEKICCWDVG